MTHVECDKVGAILEHLRHIRHEVGIEVADVEHGLLAIGKHALHAGGTAGVQVFQALNGLNALIGTQSLGKPVTATGRTGHEERGFDDHFLKIIIIPFGLSVARIGGIVNGRAVGCRITALESKGAIT